MPLAPLRTTLPPVIAALSSPACGGGERLYRRSIKLEVGRIWALTHPSSIAVANAVFSLDGQEMTT